MPDAVGACRLSAALTAVGGHARECRRAVIGTPAAIRLLIGRPLLNPALLVGGQ
jgi:hypothetical protein